MIAASTIFLIIITQQLVAVLSLPTLFLEIPISEQLPVACHALSLRVPLRLRLRRLIQARTQYVDGSGMVLVVTWLTDYASVDVGSPLHLLLVCEHFSSFFRQDTNRVFEAKDLEQTNIHLAKRFLLYLLYVALQNQGFVLYFPLGFVRLASVVRRWDKLRRFEL